MSKTPVSMLQELMQRRGHVPQYEQLPSEGTSTHMPTFYYRVKAETVEKVGKARSKKDAKHEAAKLALEAFSEMGIYHPDHYVKTPSSPVASVSVAASTNLSINAVGLLKELCEENNIPEPIFNVIADIGPPHCRQFTVECSVGTMPASCAIDLTKKKAKQAAALKMFNRLQDSLPDVIEEFSDMSCTDVVTVSKEVIDGYNEKTIQKKKVNWGMKVSTYPYVLKHMMDEKSLSYDTVWEDTEDIEVEDFIHFDDVQDLKDVLNPVLNKLELSYDIEYDILSDILDNKVIASIKIDSKPLVFAAVDDNKDKALYCALRQVFDYLRILTK